jgi:hypothetical protein
MLNVVMLNVDILIVVMLNVVVPFFSFLKFEFCYKNHFVVIYNIRIIFTGETNSNIVKVDRLP